MDDLTPQARDDSETTPPDTLVEHQIVAVVTEFGDVSSPRASATKALRWFQESGWAVDDFMALINEAAALVRRYRPTKPIPYFFATLDDLLGV